MKVYIYRKGAQKSPTEYKNVKTVGYWTDKEEFIQITDNKGYTLIPKEDVYKIVVED